MCGEESEFKHLDLRRLVLGGMDSYDSEPSHIVELYMFMIFRDLQDLHTFTPLSFEHFNKKSIILGDFEQTDKSFSDFIQKFTKDEKR